MNLLSKHVDCLSMCDYTFMHAFLFFLLETLDKLSFNTAVNQISAINLNQLWLNTVRESLVDTDKIV